MPDIDVANDLTQVNSQLEQLVGQLNQLNTQREQLTQQIHNLNGIAMYLRGKQENNGEGIPEDFAVTEEFPPEGA
mgnify:CR=1 FL=1